MTGVITSFDSFVMCYRGGLSSSSSSSLQRNQSPTWKTTAPKLGGFGLTNPSKLSLEVNLTPTPIPIRSTGPGPVRSSAADDEWGPEPKEPNGGGPSSTAVVEAPAEAEAEAEGEKEEIARLKKGLVEALDGTDRGLKATSEKRAEILEFITQLEAKNPTPAPTEALALLDGKWVLGYTSFSALFPLLGRSLPVVKVAEISQSIDSKAFTVQNSVQFDGPLASTSLTTNAKFEVRSPKRVQLKFEEGIIGTPQLTDSIVIPESIEFLGQKIDLSPFKGVISSVESTASSVARTISSQPPLKIPITNTNVQSWLLTTYLDEELRISRGDGGSVFVLFKEGSSLLSS